MEAPPALLRSERDGRALTLMRDLESEAAAWRLLGAYGLESYRKRLPKAERLDSSTECLLPVYQDAGS